jgi:hypothetical protein
MPLIFGIVLFLEAWAENLEFFLERFENAKKTF